jgi:hypothetical protein
MPAEPHSVRRIVLGALALACAYVALLALAAGLVSGRGGLAASLSSLGPGILLAVAALQLTALGLQTARWRLLLGGTDPVRLPFVQAFGIQLAAHTCNVVLPFLGGDLAASWVLQRRWGVPWARSLAASLYARVAGLLTCAALALPTAALLLGQGLPASIAAGLGRAGALVLAVAGALVLLSLFPRPLVWIGSRCGRWAQARGRAPWRGRLGQGLMLLGWWLHTTATRDRAQVAGSIALSALNYAVQTVSILVLAQGLGLTPHPIAGLALITVSALGGLTTFALPGGGLAEELVMYSLARALLQAPVAGAAALVVGFGTLRVALMALGVPLVPWYLRSTPPTELAPLWRADPAGILDLLGASAALGAPRA